MAYIIGGLFAGEMAAPPQMAEKPIDLFKAIFEDGSDSSDEEEGSQQEAGEPPPAQVRSTSHSPASGSQL